MAHMLDHLALNEQNETKKQTVTKETS
jgi:hypothetical protein